MNVLVPLIVGIAVVVGYVLVQWAHGQEPAWLYGIGLGGGGALIAFGVEGLFQPEALTPMNEIFLGAPNF